MAYYPDLSRYSYWDEEYRQNTVNVGFLSSQYDYERRKAAPELLDALARFCTVCVGLTRGYHSCEFCPPADREVIKKVPFGDRYITLGSAEIRVFGVNGAIYAAPTLIHHYVSEHDYAPPEEFVQAVLAGSAPPDPSYLNRLRDIKLAWEWNLGLKRYRPVALTDQGFVYTDEWAFAKDLP